MITIGTVKVRGNRKRANGSRPKGPEELRKLYRIMWTAWTVVRLKHRERRELSGIGRDVFEDLLDYILGERCWERNAAGKAISWDGLMTYELQIRKEAAKFVNRGKGSLTEGIRTCLSDANLRTEYYIEAVAMSGVKRGRSPPSNGQNDDITGDYRGKKGKGGHKGRKGEKGKKQGKGNKGGWAQSDRVGQAQQVLAQARKSQKLKFSLDVGGQQKSICIRYNRCEECSDCRYEHVCLRCGGPHPLIDCTAPPVPK